MNKSYDIFVSGGGIAGLVTAAGCAARGYSVCIVDPAPPVRDAQDADADLRSTAFLQPSRQLFENVGVWNTLAPHATRLAALRVIDTAGWPPRERVRRTFRPHDLGADSFGWNIPNWRSRAVLADYLQNHPGVDLRFGVGFSEMLTRTSETRVLLSDGTRIRARLVIGADGRNSPVRKALGIGFGTRRYGQNALAFSVRHETAHEDISTEIYSAGGAFTTVPLSDHDGAPASAIIWMNQTERSERLMAMTPDALGAEATIRSLGELGQMVPVTSVRAWPVLTRTAERLTGRRTALIAEAAHVLPPIGAQGLNTSLRDVAALLSCLGEDPGTHETLERYSRQRATDTAVRAGVIDIFNRLCKSQNPAIVRARYAGLRAVHDIAPIRRSVMQAGLGGDISA